ncbi:MAG: methylmalonyl Co-A mutase-associated GTPase MeaB [Candidatus Thermoplasmatota archaeon]|nr:methylmalonyl Co-A mutase-associated GTPase MeaB [Candidatus Thermoplasmatota archaeon]
MTDLAERVLEGDPRAIARMITLVENNSDEAPELMSRLHKKTGRAQVIGVTGVMGAGKSTLITELALEYRRAGKTVGIVAIDPTSPFSGGALLGDRIRMMEVSTDPGIFIRSMGTRGMLGGLSGAVFDVVEIFDAAGKEIVIIETVGVGQAEVDIIKIADTTMVVLVPGLGDSIQAIKAGLMEIADIFVINKSDRPGFDLTMAELESLVELNVQAGRKRTPILGTNAKERGGIKELVEEIKKHYNELVSSGKLDDHRRMRYETELVEIVRKRLMNLIFDEAVFKDKVDSLVNKIEKKEMGPYAAAQEILSRVLK